MSRSEFPIHIILVKEQNIGHDTVVPGVGCANGRRRDAANAEKERATEGTTGCGVRESVWCR